jgi:hypothetical protein
MLPNPARRPCQGRSPEGVERSESLDAVEHRVIMSTAAARLHNVSTNRDDSWEYGETPRNRTVDRKLVWLNGL